jgi:HEAT repeat protein
VAGHAGDLARVTDSLADADAGVRGVALGALRRLGRLTPAVVMEALTDRAPVVRRRACEEAAALAGGPAAEPVAGHTHDPERRPLPPLEPSERATLGESVTGSLADPDDAVVEAACFALGELLAESSEGAPSDVGPDADRSGDIVAALSDTAKSHRDPLCREAAVAALGSIGDDRGLAAILTATSDRPAVRRRAVLALASFVDSPGSEVADALARALGDRDWQVRQAAEDLTQSEPRE